MRLHAFNNINAVTATGLPAGMRLKIKYTFAGYGTPVAAVFAGYKHACFYLLSPKQGGKRVNNKHLTCAAVLNNT